MFRSDKAAPELIRQLSAALEKQNVGVVCHLADALGSSESTQGSVESLLERVRAVTGEQPLRVKVFRNLGSFAISAPPAFIEELLRQGEVASATANEQPEDMLIRPVKPRIAD